MMSSSSTSTLESQLANVSITASPAATEQKSDHHADAQEYSQDDIARQRSEWFIPASLASKRTLNPIRAIVDKLVVPASAAKPLIPLSIGDPTVFGNLLPPASGLTALTKLIHEGKSNGYAPSFGTKPARAAIARRYGGHGTSTCGPDLTADDIMICSGASGALQIAIDACMESGDNILLPRPGFSLYATIAGYLNVEVRYYDLLPNSNWECDLANAAKLIDSRTRALLINNPSNPNGSNFSVKHLKEIVAFAERYKLLIISDEIYADMIFTGQVFTPISLVSERVPIITVGGIAKQYLVPGWRIGWICWHDRAERLKEVRQGAMSLTQIILGANTLIQALIPTLLLDTPQDYYTTLNRTLEDQAVFLYKHINTIPGLHAIEPQGAMYLMVHFDTACFPEFPTDVDFSKTLLSEQMLFVLPGSCFLAKDFFRLVTCAPKHILEDAVARLRKFCEGHYRKPKDGVITESK